MPVKISSRWLIAGISSLTLFSIVGVLPSPAGEQTAGKSALLDATENAAFFEAKVRPLLLEQCSACHGEKQQAGGLRLDTADGLAKGANSGAVVIAGDVEKSSLLRAVHYDGKVKMPPGGKLPGAEIAALTEWVRRGAVWPATKSIPTATPTSGGFTAAQRKFWSFQPVKRSAIPSVKNAAWVKNPIDAFLLARLEAKGLKPAPPADKRTLIRRATFDLTGLPPTPAEVKAFLADKSPDAYPKLVDRLLASPRYGERWGRHWLDVVRYADSSDARGLGSEGDFSEAWRYRDWVVNAFNRDLPYDKFILNQIAGDLLPPEGAPQITSAGSTGGAKLAGLDAAPARLNIPGTIATGMLALGNWGNGDADKDKILTDIADDQVDVVSRGFMGLTVACARCHDHKFDPIATKDYYGLAGIFFSSHILPKLTPKGAGENYLRIPLETPADTERRAQYTKQTTELEARIKAEASAQYAAYVRSMLPQTQRYLVAAWSYAHRPSAQAMRTVADFAQAQGLQEIPLRNWLDYLGLNADYRLMNTPVRNVLNTPGVYTWRGVPDCPNLTVNTTAEAHMLLTFTLPPKSVSVHPGPTDGVAVEWVSPIAGTVQVTGKTVDADPACGNGIAWAVTHRQAAGTVELASGAFPNGGRQDFTEGKTPQNLHSVAVQPGDRLQLLVLPNGDYSCDTTTVEFVIHAPIAMATPASGGSRTWPAVAARPECPRRSSPPGGPRSLRTPIRLRSRRRRRSSRAPSRSPTPAARSHPLLKRRRACCPPTAVRR
jgi:mono/diheme cytochrome c family protein